MIWSSLPLLRRRMLNSAIILGGSMMFVKELLDRVREARCARERELWRRKTGALALGVSIGCTVGAVAGVLFAPKTGAETRKEVARRSRETWEKIKHNASSGGHRLAQAMEEKGAQVCDAAEKCVDAAKEVLHEPDKKTFEKNPDN